MIFIKRFLQYLCAIFGKEPRHTSSHNMSKGQLKISCSFYRITDLGILQFYFSNKSYSSKAYTSLEKVVVLGTQSTKKLSLQFLDFSMIFNQFYKFQLKHIRGKESLYS
jgi:hypothetical protein